MNQVRGWRRVIPFRVHIAGIIEIMGSSLYSRATTPIRELIQNAHDGIMRRRQQDSAYRGRIDVAQDAAAHTISFSDDGIGLTEEEADRYLGTLGIGLTGMIKRGADGAAESGETASTTSGTGELLIGQFGIGLFSAFMLADRMVVQTRKVGAEGAIRWEAGPGTDVELSSDDRADFGTTVTLYLKPRFHNLAEDAVALEQAIKDYADFLPIPIHLNRSAARVNLIHATWFDPTPDPEGIELELESFFHETALEVIPIEIPAASIRGALYVTPQRTPGFTSEAVVTATIRRMVISRRIQGLLPAWASFIRGVLELGGCAPTASREDVVRDESFEKTKAALDSFLLQHFENLAQRDPAKLQSIISWHRYTLSGASLTTPRLRDLMRRSYPFATSQGLLTFDEILQRSGADPVFESEASYVLWYNTERRQEQWLNGLFAANSVPCVHVIRSFEDSLLAAFAADASEKAQIPIEMRVASPGSPNFAEVILGVGAVSEADPAWQEFLGVAGVTVLIAGFDKNQPVMAFLNERHELMQTFEELRKKSEIPAGFARLIDQHFSRERPKRNEILLNRDHDLVRRALAQSVSHPLASVLRLLVFNALTVAGASIAPQARRLYAEDLGWVSDAISIRHK